MREYPLSTTAAVVVPEEERDGFRHELRGMLPKGAARRMTMLGMLVHAVLARMPLERNTPLFYATEFAETGALERFIDSFPQASPQGFQASIHPSGVEQNLILREHALTRFYPVVLTPGGFPLVLRLAAGMGVPSIVVVAEERGGWLLEAGLSATTSFALAFVVAPGAEDGAEARFVAGAPTDREPQPTTVAMTALAQALSERAGWSAAFAGMGAVELRWS